MSTMSSSSRKIQRGGLDLLSNLPDALIIRILSFLRTKEAVRTCVLSRRWSRLWAFLTTLDLDDYDFDGDDEFREFVTNALLLRENVPIHSLNLSVRCQPSSSNWLCHALSRGLEKLDFALRWDHHEVELPTSLFTSSSLQEMLLDLANARLTWPAASRLVSLKKLCLTSVWLITTAPCLISSCCPALEDWTMMYCELPRTLVVSCARLEHFGLSKCEGTSKLIVSGERLLRFSLLDCFPNKMLELFKISSPSLRSFVWDSREAKSFDISNLNALVFASVDIRRLDVGNIQEPLKQLMCGLSNATKLQVGNLLIEALGFLEESHQGLTPNLYSDLAILQLDCGFRKHDLLAMSCLLRCCPKLNTLFLTINTKIDFMKSYYVSPTYDRDEEEFCCWVLDGKEFWQAQNLLLEQLRTVELREFMVLEVGIEFIFYLLDVAKSLTKITITPAIQAFSFGAESSWRTAKRLFEMQKNPKIDVIFPD